MTVGPFLVGWTFCIHHRRNEPSHEAIVKQSAPCGRTQNARVFKIVHKKVSSFGDAIFVLSVTPTIHLADLVFPASESYFTEFCVSS